MTPLPCARPRLPAFIIPLILCYATPVFAASSWTQSKKLKVRLKKGSAGPGSMSPNPNASPDEGGFPLSAELLPTPKLKQRSRARPQQGGGGGGGDAGAGSVSGSAVKDKSHSGGEKVLPKIRITFNAKGTPKITPPKAGGSATATASTDVSKMAPLKMNSFSQHPQSAMAGVTPHAYTSSSGSPPLNLWGGSALAGLGKKRVRPAGSNRRQQLTDSDREGDAEGFMLPPRSRNRAPSPYPSLVIKPPEPEPVLSVEESLRRTCIKLVSPPRLQVSSGN